MTRIKHLRALFAVIPVLTSNLSAGERARNGNYEGSRSYETRQQTTTRSPGQSERTTTWQNEKGQGTSSRKRVWDKRSSSKIEDGYRDVSAYYAEVYGQTVDVDKTVTKTEEGREVTGTYETSTGKSGTFNSKTTVKDGTVVNESTLTNQDGKTGTRKAETSSNGTGVTRKVDTASPSGTTRSRSGTATVDK